MVCATGNCGNRQMVLVKLSADVMWISITYAAQIRSIILIQVDIFKIYGYTLTKRNSLHFHFAAPAPLPLPSF